MKEKEIKNILEFYNTISKLKTTLRQGWIEWKANADRLESVAEHVFGACMLAVAIAANGKSKIDINRVVLMLALHDTEEAIIGDISLDNPSEHAASREKGRAAVLEIFKEFANKKYFIDLINEFEDGKTKDAEFAFMVDKLESDLQAMKYEFELDKVDPKIYEQPKLKELQSKGYSKPYEFFLQKDKELRFSGDFIKIAEFLEKQQKGLRT